MVRYPHAVFLPSIWVPQNLMACDSAHIVFAQELGATLLPGTRICILLRAEE